MDGLIAEGGFGWVFKRYDPELHHPVAIKIPKPRSGVTSERADMLLEEARKIAKLRHPGIVAVHVVGRQDSSIFVVSDLIDGENLAIGLPGANRQYPRRSNWSPRSPMPWAPWGDFLG